MIYSILVRLFVKELVKLKCVSKLWLNMIESPEFAKSHTIHHLFNFKSERLICGNLKLNYHPIGIFSFLPFPEKYCLNQNSLSPKMLCWPGQIYEKNRIVGTSRGIICLQYTQGGGVYVCNPWIRKCRKVPRCRLESPPEQRQWLHNVYGFGYDEVEDDFKVFKLTGIRRNTEPEKTFATEGKFYSLKSSTWTSIESIPYLVHRVNSGFFYNHSLHWMFSNNSDSFVSVDIRTGKHTLLPLPDDLRILRSWEIGECNGYLCFSKSILGHFEFWLMKDSWTKHVFVVPITTYGSHFIRYMKNENQEQLFYSATLEYSICLILMTKSRITVHTFLPHIFSF